MDDRFREIILATAEEVLAAELEAVRSLRTRPAAKRPPRQAGMSQIDMAHAILRTAQQPLHVSQIIEQAAERFGVALDRESVVSSLTKRVARADRFVRVGPNCFALRTEE